MSSLLAEMKVNWELVALIITAIATVLTALGTGWVAVATDRQTRQITLGARRARPEVWITRGAPGGMFALIRICVRNFANEALVIESVEVSQAVGARIISPADLSNLGHTAHFEIAAATSGANAGKVSPIRVPVEGAKTIGPGRAVVPLAVFDGGRDEMLRINFCWRDNADTPFSVDRPIPDP